MVTGEVVGAIGMTEPGAGSDLQSMRTSAILQDDHYLFSRCVSANNNDTPFARA
jgi:alkylation response protein AidB-like acyl-CoA dehydrogenase